MSRQRSAVRLVDGEGPRRRGGIREGELEVVLDDHVVVLVGVLASW